MVDKKHVLIYCIWHAAVELLCRDQIYSIGWHIVRHDEFGKCTKIYLLQVIWQGGKNNYEAEQFGNGRDQ